MSWEPDADGRIETQIAAAATRGLEAVADVLARSGRTLNERLASDLSNDLVPFQGRIFRACIVIAAEWAGWIASGTNWRVDAPRYLETQAPHLVPLYRRGYR